MRHVEVREAAQDVEDGAVQRPVLVLRLIEEFPEAVDLFNGRRVELVAFLRRRVHLEQEAEEDTRDFS